MGAAEKAKVAQTYSARIDCRNCGLDRRIDISKGTRIGDHVCPQCGCRTLRRHMFS